MTPKQYINILKKINNSFSKIMSIWRNIEEENINVSIQHSKEKENRIHFRKEPVELTDAIKNLNKEYKELEKLLIQIKKADFNDWDNETYITIIDENIELANGCIISANKIIRFIRKRWGILYKDGNSIIDELEKKYTNIKNLVLYFVYFIPIGKFDLPTIKDVDRKILVSNDKHKEIKEFLKNRLN